MNHRLIFLKYFLHPVNSINRISCIVSKLTHNLQLNVNHSSRTYFHRSHKFRTHSKVRSGEITTLVSLPIKTAEWFCWPALTSVRKIADGLQLSIALTVCDLCKRDRVCYKERALRLVKKTWIIPILLPVAFILLMCYAVQEAHISPSLMSFLLLPKYPWNLQWLSWWPRGRDWLPWESTIFVGHWPEIPICLHVVWYRREKVLSPEGTCKNEMKWGSLVLLKFLCSCLPEKVSDVLKY